MNRPTGLARFAPGRPARGAMFAARRRAGRSEASTVEPVITEAEYYPGTPVSVAPRDRRQDTWDDWDGLDPHGDWPEEG